MAEEISEKNNQTIKKGKTLGEIINDFPMVKSLRKAAPGILGKYDFAPAIILALKDKKEIGNDISVDTIMSAEEEDFIRNSFSSLIEQAIEADVNKNASMIVISNGRFDEKATLEKCKELGIDPSVIGGRIEQEYKEQSKKEKATSFLNDINPIITKIEEATSINALYNKDNSFTKEDLEEFRQNAKEGKQFFEEKENDVVDGEKTAEIENDKYLNPESYTDEELIDFGKDFNRKKRSPGFVKAFFAAERRLDDREKWGVIKLISDFNKMPIDQREAYLESHKAEAGVILNPKNQLLFERYRISAGMHQAIIAQRSVVNLMANQKLYTMSQKEKDKFKKKTILQLLNGLKYADLLGLDNSMRQQFLMALCEVEPALANETPKGYELVGKKKLIEQVAIITGVPIKTEEDLDQLLQDGNDSTIETIVKSFAMKTQDENSQKLLCDNIRKRRRLTKFELMNSYSKEKIGNIVYSYEEMKRIYEETKTDYNFHPTKGEAVLNKHEIAMMKTGEAYKRATMDECTMFIRSMPAGSFTPNEVLDCIEKLSMAVEYTMPGGKKYLDNGEAISLFKKLSPKFVNEETNELNEEVITALYSKHSGREAGSLKEIASFSRRSVRSEFGKVSNDFLYRKDRIEELKRRISDLEGSKKSKELADAQEELNILKAEEREDVAGNMIYSNPEMIKAYRPNFIDSKNHSIPEDAMSRLFEVGDELVVQTKEDVMKFLENEGTTLLVTPPTKANKLDKEKISRISRLMAESGLNYTRQTRDGYKLTLKGTAAALMFESRELKKRAMKDSNNHANGEYEDEPDLDNLGDQREDHRRNNHTRNDFEKRIQAKVDVLSAIGEMKKSRTAPKEKTAKKEQKKDEGRSE